MKILKTYIQDNKTGVKKITESPATPVHVDDYEHVQGAPEQVWAINHNLNRYPSTTILDFDGNEYEAEIQHVDKNNIIIIFSIPFSGTAVLN